MGQMARASGCDEMNSLRAAVRHSVVRLLQSVSCKGPLRLEGTADLFV